MNVDDSLARINAASGSVRYYHSDALSSIIGLSDESGQEVAQYAYDPFGNTSVSGEASDNPLQYTGRENDGTGLYYYRARYYSPELQRFISEDPIGLKGGDINFFVYAKNAPLDYRDPEGLSWGLGAGAAFGGAVGCLIIYCVKRCENHCKQLYPSSQDPLSSDSQRFWNCMGPCLKYCVSFGAFGSDPLSGAATAPSHRHLE